MKEGKMLGNGLILNVSPENQMTGNQMNSVKMNLELIFSRIYSLLCYQNQFSR